MRTGGSALAPAARPAHCADRGYAKMHRSMAPQTMYDKIWESHLVRDVPANPA